MSLPVGLRAWRLLTGALSPLARLLLRQRATRGKEDWTRLNERLGQSGLPRPDGRLVGSMVPVWGKACRRCR